MKPLDPHEADSSHAGLSDRNGCRSVRMIGKSVRGIPSIAKPANDDDFSRNLVMLIPQLHAFARSLCGHHEFADDLAQEAILKALGAQGGFQPGTNLRAWVFVILRNIFLSEMRRTRFRAEWDDSVAARALTTAPSQEHHLRLGDLQRAFLCLPQAQRDALIVIAVGGLSYEEAAMTCACAVGTIKSRVSRARIALKRMLEDDACPPRTERAREFVSPTRSRHSRSGTVLTPRAGKPASTLPPAAPAAPTG